MLRYSYKNKTTKQNGKRLVAGTIAPESLSTEQEEIKMTATEKIMMNVEGKFWTRRNEMVDELEGLDYEVTSINNEYLIVTDLQDEDDGEYILHLGHANSTMWIESAEKTF